eukprot:6203528-Pleurochrysis_carterae.AAC.2
MAPALFTMILSPRAYLMLVDNRPVSYLLNVDITADASSVELKQKEYIAHLNYTYLPDGVPLA